MSNNRDKSAMSGASEQRAGWDELHVLPLEGREEGACFVEQAFADNNIPARFTLVRGKRNAYMLNRGKGNP